MGMLKSTFGLHADKIAHLLGLGLDRDAEGPGPDYVSSGADLLQERLAEHLPSELPQLGPLSKDWEPFGRTISGALGLSLRELLLASDTDPGVLRQVKDYAAILSNSAPSADERQVANVIYYAAIGSALLHHGHMLTEFSRDELYVSFSRLAEVPWIAPEFVQLFAAAAGACRNADGRETQPHD